MFSFTEFQMEPIHQRCQSAGGEILRQSVTPINQCVNCLDDQLVLLISVIKNASVLQDASHFQLLACCQCPCVPINSGWSTIQSVLVAENRLIIQCNELHARVRCPPCSIAPSLSVTTKSIAEIILRAPISVAHCGKQFAHSTMVQCNQ